MKKTAVIAIAGVLLVGCLAGRYAWISMSTVRLESSRPMDHGKYVAKMSSSWASSFWGGAPVEIHEIWIESIDGHVVRHIVTKQPSNGFPDSGVLDWSLDESYLKVKLRANSGWGPHLCILVPP